jgi:hypothetical protein
MKLKTWNKEADVVDVVNVVSEEAASPIEPVASQTESGGLESPPLKPGLSIFQSLPLKIWCGLTENNYANK